MKNPFSLSSKYNTLAMVIAGVIVATIVIILFLIRPAWSQLKTLGQEIPVEQQKRDTAKSEMEFLEKAKTYLDQNEDKVETVNIAVPIEPDVSEILALLEEVSKKNGVSLTSFSPQQVGGGAVTGAAAAAVETANPGAESVEISANFEGSYTSVINFFFNVEKSLRLVDVKTISVTGSGGSTAGGLSSGGAMRGTMSFKAYYKVVDGGPKPAGATTTPGAPK